MGVCICFNSISERFRQPQFYVRVFPAHGHPSLNFLLICTTVVLTAMNHRGLWITVVYKLLPRTTPMAETETGIDLIWGINAIAKLMGRTDRQAFHMASTGQIPAK